MNKNQITHRLQEIGAAWAVSSDKYVCTDYQCCNVLDGDKPAYHVHPDSSYPHVNHIYRFKSLVEIAGYIAARKAAEKAVSQGDETAAWNIMEDFRASLV